VGFGQRLTKGDGLGPVLRFESGDLSAECGDDVKATSPRVAAIKDGNVWGTISLLLSVTTSSIRIAKILV
jgi:hypothetical protein